VSPGSVVEKIREAVAAPAYYAFNASSRGSGEFFSCCRIMCDVYRVIEVFCCTPAGSPTSRRIG
jgi:hypothetical protein